MLKMTSKEFEKLYCAECDMYGECSDGCSPYHDMVDETKNDPSPSMTKIVNHIIDLSRAMSNTDYQVYSVRIAANDITVHIESTGIVEQLADTYGVELYHTDDGVYIYFAGVKIIALYW